MPLTEAHFGGFFYFQHKTAPLPASQMANPNQPAAKNDVPPALPLLDPRNDLVFKLLFGHAPHLLTDLINAVRPNDAPIVVQQVMNPRIDAADISGKFIVLDILAKAADGELLNIEMQMSRREKWSAAQPVLPGQGDGQPIEQRREVCKLKTGNRYPFARLCTLFRTPTRAMAFPYVRPNQPGGQTW